MSPEAVPSNASVASAGPGLRYVGQHAYAFSGVVAVDDNETTLLDFNPGSGVIDCIIQFHYVEVSTDNMFYTIKVNGEIVMRYYTSDSHSVASMPDNPLYVLFPPFSRVQLLCENQSSSTPRDQCVTIVGRVYGED